MQGTQFELAFFAMEVQSLLKLFALEDCILLSSQAGFVYRTATSLRLSSYSAFLGHAFLSHVSSGFGI